MTQRITVDEIVSATTELFGVPVGSIIARGRLRPVARARQAAMWLTAQLTGLTFEEIGHEFGRDRTTVRYGCEAIDTVMSSDAVLAEQLDHLRSAFRGEETA
jgi:chromosomal replication initiator protein